MNRPNTADRSKPRQPAGALAAASLLLITAAVALLDPAVASAPSAGSPQWLGVVGLNLLPPLIVFALLLAATGRALFSAWLVILLLSALHAANMAKLATLEMPLLPADFQLLANPGPTLDLLWKYVHVGLWQWLLIALAALITALLWRLYPRVLSGMHRVALGLLALAGGASLVAGSAPWQRLFDANALGFQLWEQTLSSARVGLLGNLVLYNWQIGSGDIPSGDHALAARFLERHRAALPDRDQRSRKARPLPDIVVVQSESLFDPARVSGVAENRWLPAYHRLSRRATAGDLWVPTFVGGTIRTEFEVLTGAPLTSLGGVQYPWLELKHADYPNLARLLGAHGYRRIAIHPNPAAFWNRARTYPALGFEHFIDSTQFDGERIVGLFLSDAAMTDRILAELDDSEAPHFVFAISMENHGPFDWRPNLDPERLARLQMPPALDPGGRLWFGNYLYLLDDADRELGRLAQALHKRRRRTLLLFYGDHLPGLAPVYQQLGFKNGRQAIEQPVPWLLLDTASKRAKRLDTHSWMLPGLLLRAAGLHDAAWFDLVADLALDPAFDPTEPQAAEGLEALARLQLRGELDPLLAQLQSSRARGSADTQAAQAHAPSSPTSPSAAPR